MNTLQTYFEFALVYIIEGGVHASNMDEICEYLCLTSLAMQSADDNKQFEYDLLNNLIDLSKTNITKEEFIKTVKSVLDNLCLM